MKSKSRPLQARVTLRDKRHGPPLPNAVIDTSDDADRSAEINDDIAVVKLSVLAAHLGVSSWTINRWIKAGRFPSPIYLTASSPAVWRLRDIKAFLDKRRRARHVKKAPRGALKLREGASDAP